MVRLVSFASIPVTARKASLTGVEARPPPGFSGHLMKTRAQAIASGHLDSALFSIDISHHRLRLLLVAEQVKLWSEIPWAREQTDGAGRYD